MAALEEAMNSAMQACSAETTDIVEHHRPGQSLNRIDHGYFYRVIEPVFWIVRQPSGEH